MDILLSDFATETFDVDGVMTVWVNMGKAKGDHKID